MGSATARGAGRACDETAMFAPAARRGAVTTGHRRTGEAASGGRDPAASGDGRGGRSQAPAGVGAAGFEPATSATQTPRAARLRHAPWGASMAGGRGPGRGRVHTRAGLNARARRPITRPVARTRILLLLCLALTALAAPAEASAAPCRGAHTAPREGNRTSAHTGRRTR